MLKVRVKERRKKMCRFLFELFVCVVLLEGGRDYVERIGLGKGEEEFKCVF